MTVTPDRRSSSARTSSAVPRGNERNGGVPGLPDPAARPCPASLPGLGRIASRLSREASAAWMPPTSGSIRSWYASSPNLRAMKDAMDSSSPLVLSRTSGLSSARRLPASDSRGLAARAAVSMGTMPEKPCGRGASTWLCMMNELAVRGVRGITPPAIPRSSQSRRTSGLVVRKLSGPASSTKPSTRSVRILPPTFSSCSTSVMSRPGARRDASQAAERPVIPPPMIRTSLFSNCTVLCYRYNLLRLMEEWIEYFQAEFRLRLRISQLNLGLNLIHIFSQYSGLYSSSHESE